MIKQLTIGFQFRKKCYLARLSIRPQEKDSLHLMVEVFNKSLYKMLPDGKIMYTLTQGALAPVNSTDKANEELTHSISQAVLEHMKVLEGMHSYPAIIG